MRVLAEMERVGIAADTQYLSELEAQFAAEVKAAAQAALRGGGAGVQPRLAQAAAGDPLHRARPAEDQEDQDGLHHRRRRAAVALRADRHPVLEHLLRHRDVAKLKSTVDGLLKSVADDGRIHTTFNQTVAATGRPVAAPTQPAEHPDPHRGGPAHPAGVRGRRGLRDAC